MDLRSPNMNMIIISGNLVKDPELRYTTTGTPVLKFSIAHNKRYKKDDEWVEIVSFFTVETFIKAAESIHARLHVGSPVQITGELRQNRWQDKDENPRSMVKIIANRIECLEKMSAAPEEHENEKEDKKEDKKGKTKNGTTEEKDDSVPF